MSWLYLLAIVASTVCMGLIDHRWRLVVFDRPARALLVLAAGGLFFLSWDLVAIDLGIYGRGGSRAMTGVELVSELPLEEVFFVVFFCYVTMVLHGSVQTVLARVRGRTATRTLEAEEATR